MHMIEVIYALPLFSGVPAFLEDKNSTSPVGIFDQGQTTQGNRVKEHVTTEFEFAALEWGTGSGARLKIIPLVRSLP
jgi:hypothetical protein